MMKTAKTTFILLFALAAGTFFTSCLSQQKIKYLQSAQDSTAAIYTSIRPNHVLQPGDYLYIKFFSLDEKSNEVFASITGAQNYAGQQSDQNLYLTSYLIDQEGYVSFPILGRVMAKGKTVAELEKTLGHSIGEIVREASVVVKLVHFNISVIGEVKSPGKYPIYSDRVNIFEALAMAGDLTTFGRRDKVVIVRNNNDQNTVHTINLTRRDLLSSDNYYLQPNDIVYVEPLKNKAFAFETFPYSMVFSTITTLLVIATFFK